MKKKYTRFIALFLALIMVFICAPIVTMAEEETISSESLQEKLTDEDFKLTNYELDTQVKPSDTRILREVIDRREENAKHYLLADGTYQVISYGAPIHRKDEKGAWQDIDNRLIASKSVSNYYTTTDERIMLSITAESGKNLVTIKENGYVVSMAPLMSSRSNTKIENIETTKSVNIVNHSQMSAVKSGMTTVEEVANSINSKTSAKYENVFESADIEYILDSNDIKENIIVKESKEKYEYAFLLSLDKLIAILNDDGSISICDEKTKEQQYLIPAPYMFDANGIKSHNVYYELSTVDIDKYLLLVKADENWINMQDRVFPITIDPTIQKRILLDTWINQSNPTVTYPDSESLFVANSAKAFFNTTIPSFPNGATIEEAYLIINYYYVDHVTSGYLDVGVYEGKSGSAASNTWNYAMVSPGNCIANTDMSEAELNAVYRNTFARISNPGTAMIPISNSLVQRWISNPSTRYGVWLGYKGGSLNSVLIHSYESSYTSYRPLFLFKYSEPSIPNGVYKIKNFSSHKYIDVNDAVYPGINVIQNDATYSNDRDQLFKITFLGRNTDESNCYSIRPMTNSGLSLSYRNAMATLSRCTLSESLELFSGNYWIISEDQGYYSLQYNGYDGFSSNNYLKGATSDNVLSMGAKSSSAMWSLEQYTGSHMNGASIITSSNTMYVGRDYSFESYMYSTEIGVNGPVEFQVRNGVNLFTIDSDYGFLYITPLVPGNFQLNLSYNDKSTVSIYGFTISYLNLSRWYSDVDSVAFWKDAPKIYHPSAEEIAAVQNENDPDNYYYFQYGLECAEQAWSEALGIQFEYTTNKAEADIIWNISTSTDYPEHANSNGFVDYNSDDNGVIIDYTYCNAVYNGQIKTVKILDDLPPIDIYIFVDQRAGIMYSYNHVNTMLHELGHALGFMGHSTLSTDVMRPLESADTTLSSSEIRHLLQIYEAFG